MIEQHGDNEGSVPSNLFRNMKIWAACLVAPEAIVVALTMFRLIHRARARMLWWDDYSAMIGLLFTLPFYGTTWLILISSHWSRSLQIPVGWVVMFSFMPGLWATRVSLTLSIARVLPLNHFLFRTLIFLSISFVILGAASVAQLATLCAVDPGWQNRPPYMCPPSRSGSVFPYTASLTSDLALVMIPLLLFRKVKLPAAAKRLILVGFAASAFLAPVVILNLVFGLIPYGQTPLGIVLRGMLMHLSELMSLIACNALVVMTFFYRRRYRDGDSFLSELSAISPGLQTPRSASSRHLTFTESDFTSLPVPSPTFPRQSARTDSCVLTEVSLHSSDFSAGASSSNYKDGSLRGTVGKDGSVI